jgi:hypothetical protein
MSVRWLARTEFFRAAVGRILPTPTVLDVGCGIRPQTIFPAAVHLLVEPYLPYLERVRQEIGAAPRYVLLNCTWDVAMRLLPDRSVDTIFALDFIEHLEKDDGRRFLAEAERVARQQIVIFTPLGFYPQSYTDSTRPDRWGLQGGYWQTHRSGWTVEDFPDPWELLCCEAFHLVDENDAPLERPFGAVWALRNLSAASADLSFQTRRYGAWLLRRALRKLKQLAAFRR